MATAVAAVLTSTVCTARTNGAVPRCDTSTTITATAAQGGSARLASRAIRAADARRVFEKDTDGGVARFSALYSPRDRRSWRNRRPRVGVGVWDQAVAPPPAPGRLPPPRPA